MDIPLQTLDVWEIEGDPSPRKFLPAVAHLVRKGDVIVFAAYEPTDTLLNALLSVGGIIRPELRHFYTCFESNRREHPNGCAVEFTVTDDCITKILGIPDAKLRQADIPSFYDSFIAYRPGIPLVPLLTFHDAAYGGTLYISGLYTEKEATEFSAILGLSPKSILNPVLDFMKK